MSSSFLKFFKYFLLFWIQTQYIFIFNFATTKSWLIRQNGERGIWTLAPLLTTYSLSRGAPSASWVFLQLIYFHKKTSDKLVLLKRREWDSNPRALSDKRFSRPPRYDHFDISPFIHLFSLGFPRDKMYINTPYRERQHLFLTFFIFF